RPRRELKGKAPSPPTPRPRSGSEGAEGAESAGEDDPLPRCGGEGLLTSRTPGELHSPRLDRGRCAGPQWEDTRSRRMRLGLVTGGAGFIGSHPVRALLSRGYRGPVLDNLSPGRFGHLPPPPALALIPRHA